MYRSGEGGAQTTAYVMGSVQMNTQFRRLGRADRGRRFFCLGLAACPLMSATTAMAQVAIVSPSAPNQPSRRRRRRRRQGRLHRRPRPGQAGAPRRGQPLDADQIDFNDRQGRQAAGDNSTRTPRSRRAGAGGVRHRPGNPGPAAEGIRRPPERRSLRPASHSRPSSCHRHTVGTFTSAAGFMAARVHGRRQRLRGQGQRSRQRIPAVRRLTPGA